MTSTFKKPQLVVEDQDGNIFAVLSSATLALKRIGERAKANEMKDRVFDAKSYAEALSIIGEYIDWV